MYKKYILIFSIAGILIMLYSACSTNSKSSHEKPNIIVLLSDDAGYADFAFHGSTTHLTPNIDKMASDGIQFSNAYVSASVCSPSRAGLVTGRHQNRFGHYNNLPGDRKQGIAMQERGLPLSELTFANLLKKEGYKTAHIGKWHLGDSEIFLPDMRGFDQYIMLKGGHAENKLGKLNSNYKKDSELVKKYRTDLFGDEACSYIEENKDNPFFLYLAFHVPHSPMQARPDYLEEMRGRFKTDARAINACMTKSLDVNIGKVMAKLEELDLDDNTLVIYLNDNGGAMPYNASLNAPLRGTKGTLLEGGIRVPYVIKWPAKLPEGKVFDAPVSSLDILPTAVAAANGELPSDRIYDGVDLVPFITGKDKSAPHLSLCWNFQWAKAIREGNWKLLETPDGETCLFDLSKDIAEENNLADKYPEKVIMLQEKFQKWDNKMAEPLWKLSENWKSHSSMRYDQSVVAKFIKE